MTEASARYQAVRRCVACHERLTDRQVWDSNRVCRHCGRVSDYGQFCDTYTTSEACDSSPETQAFETAVRRALVASSDRVRIVSLTLAHRAWEARVKTLTRLGVWCEKRLMLGEITGGDPYAAPESLARGIEEALRPPAPSALPSPLAPAAPALEAPLHGTFINDLRLLLADLGISAMWKAGLTRVRRLLTVGVRLRR